MAVNEKQPIKIAVVGEAACGKTWLIRALRRITGERDRGRIGFAAGVLAAPKDPSGKADRPFGVGDAVGAVRLPFAASGRTDIRPRNPPCRSGEADPLWSEGADATCIVRNSRDIPFAIHLTELTGYPRFTPAAADKRLPFAGVVVYDSTNYYDALNARYATNTAYADLYDGDRLIRCLAKIDGRNEAMAALWNDDANGAGYKRYETSAASGRGVLAAFVALIDAMTIEPPRLARSCVTQMLRDGVRVNVLPPGMRTEYRNLRVERYYSYIF
jgi:GTPase SAR1 family protein